jgi:serine/threonine-protein kinase
VVQNVASINSGGWAQFGVAGNGTLVYVPGTGASAEKRTLVWVDRKGQETPLAASPNAYSHPRISPDGTRLALCVGVSENYDIWIWDLSRETLTRLTFDEAPDFAPLWSLDGQQIVFASTHKGGPGIYRQAADGTGEAELLASITRMTAYPSSWSRDGKMLVLEATGESANTDVGTLAMEGSHTWNPLLHKEFIEANPHVSRNGRWIAYFSNESGRAEIYVRPFPDVDKGKWQVSKSGGMEPRWSRDGRELFYRNGDAMMVVDVETEPTFKSGTPKTLFRGNYHSYQGHNWDLSPDGKRFLMIKQAQPAGDKSTPAAERQKLNVILNWFEELKQHVPAK